MCITCPEMDRILHYIHPKNVSHCMCQYKKNEYKREKLQAGPIGHTNYWASLYH